MNQACPQCAFPFAEGQQDAFSFCPKCSFPLMRVAGKYRLTRLLGEGSFGRVYLARHMNLRHKPERVIKVMRSDVLRQHGMEERFWREVQLTAALSEQNAHVVRVYDDFGEEEGLGFYYVMEYLRGRSLKEVCRACGPLPTPLVWHIFQQLCEAATLAHNEGIIHRDLKPQNIYLIPRGRDPYFVKIFDFGIAKSLVEAKQADWTRGALGTPAYMAPEQCSNRQIDQRTDLYAMAVILYEMLSGRTPFLFDGLAQGTSPDPMAILIAHMTQSPVPLTKQAPWLAIDPALDQVILKALSKDPAERFESVESFWRAILRFLPPDTFQQTLPTPHELLGPEAPVLSSDGWSAIDSVEESDILTPVPSSSALWKTPPESAEKPNEHADASDEYAFPSSAFAEKNIGRSMMWPERTLDLGGILTLRKEQQTLALGEGDLLEEVGLFSEQEEVRLFSEQEDVVDLLTEDHTPDPRRLVETLNLRVPTETALAADALDGASHTADASQKAQTALDVSPFTQPLPRPAFVPIWSDALPQPHPSEPPAPSLQEPTRAYGTFQDEASFAASPFQSELSAEAAPYQNEKSTVEVSPYQNEKNTVDASFFPNEKTTEYPTFSSGKMLDPLSTQPQTNLVSPLFQEEQQTLEANAFQQAPSSDTSRPETFSPSRSPVESIKIPLFLAESSPSLSSLPQERTLELQNKKRAIFYETDNSDTELSERKKRKTLHEQPFSMPPVPPVSLTLPKLPETEPLASFASVPSTPSAASAVPSFAPSAVPSFATSAASAVPSSSAALSMRSTSPQELPDFSEDSEPPVLLAAEDERPHFSEENEPPVLLAAEDEVSEAAELDDAPVLLAAEDEVSEAAELDDAPVLLAAEDEVSEAAELDDAPVLLAAEDEVSEAAELDDAPVLLAEEDPLLLDEQHRSRPNAPTQTEESPVLLEESPPVRLDPSPANKPTLSPHEAVTVAIPNPLHKKTSPPTESFSANSPSPSAVSSFLPPSSSPTARPTVPFAPPPPPFSAPSLFSPAAASQIRGTLGLAKPSDNAIPSPSFSGIFTDPPAPPDSGFLRELDRLLDGLGTHTRKDKAEPSAELILGTDDLFESSEAAEKPTPKPPEPSVELILGTDDLVEHVQTTEHPAVQPPEPSVEWVLGQNDLIEPTPQTDEHPPVAKTSAQTDEHPPVAKTSAQTDEHPPVAKTSAQTDEHPPVASDAIPQATHEMPVLLDEAEPTQDWQDTLDSRELDAVSQGRLSQILDETREPAALETTTEPPSAVVGAVTEPKKTAPLFALPKQDARSAFSPPKNTPLALLMSNEDDDDLPPPPTSEVDISRFASADEPDAEAIRKALVGTLPPNTPLTTSAFQALFEEAQAAKNKADTATKSDTPTFSAEQTRHTLQDDDAVMAPKLAVLLEQVLPEEIDEADALEGFDALEVSDASKEEALLLLSTPAKHEAEKQQPTDQDPASLALSENEDEEDEPAAFSAPPSSSARRLRADASLAKPGAFASLLDEAHKTEALIEATFGPSTKAPSSSSSDTPRRSDEEPLSPTAATAASASDATIAHKTPVPSEQKPPSVRSAFSIQAVLLTDEEAKELQISTDPTEEEQIAARLLKDESQDGLLTEESLPSSLPARRAETSGVDRKAPLRLSPTSLLVDENTLFEAEDAALRRRHLVIGGTLVLSVLMIFVALGTLLGWFSSKPTSSLQHPSAQAGKTNEPPARNVLASASKNDLPLDIRDVPPSRSSETPDIGSSQPLRSHPPLSPTARTAPVAVPPAVTSSPTALSVQKQPLSLPFTPPMPPTPPAIPPLPADPNALPAVSNEPPTPRIETIKPPQPSSRAPALPSPALPRGRPRKRPKVATATSSNDRCPEGMAWIAAGAFPMGSAVSDPMHFFGEKALVRTSTSGFCIDRYEAPGKGEMPIRDISWSDAKAHCATKGKRLCSEIEWERACKGSSERRFPYGNTFQPNRCNTRDAKGRNRSIRRGGSMPRCKSPFGVFDLSGNVAEWTSSPFLRKGWRIIRGGSFNRPDWDVRCASRGGLPPNSRKSSVGFRCCSSPK
ncbi:SUMF1/EgtB/PvdO family nonheme iron enzyme [Myxococcota bacterium]|nr:SUMF1/EgtB/PvdO family nonheme iron enzyme [Myxococcota bacterium]